KYYLDEEKTSKLVAQLEAKHSGERMSRQAVETYNESELPKEHGDMIQAFNRQHLKDGICPTLTTRPEGFKTASLPIVESVPQMLEHVDIRGNDSIKRVYSPDGINPTLTTMGGGHREPKIAEEVRPVLTPDRIEKRQNDRRSKEDGEPAFTVNTRDRLGIAVGTIPPYSIRNLPPLECFRLQGFPDDVHQALVDAGISDSQRY